MGYQKYGGAGQKKTSPETSGAHYRSEDMEVAVANNQSIRNLMKRRTSEEKTSQKLGRSSEQQLRVSYQQYIQK